MGFTLAMPAAATAADWAPTCGLSDGLVNADVLVIGEAMPSDGGVLVDVRSTSPALDLSTLHIELDPSNLREADLSHGGTWVLAVRVGADGRSGVLAGSCAAIAVTTADAEVFASMADDLIVAWKAEPSPERDNAVRAVLFDTLEQLESPAAVAAVARDLEPLLSEADTDWLVLRSYRFDLSAYARCWAIEQLVRFQCEDCVPTLMGLEYDESARVRLAALSALGDIGDTQATSALIGGLYDDLPDVRGAAAHGLSKVQTDEALVELSLAFEGESDLFIAVAIIESVERYPDPDRIEVADRWLALTSSDFLKRIIRSHLLGVSDAR